MHWLFVNQPAATNNRGFILEYDQVAEREVETLNCKIVETWMGFDGGCLYSGLVLKARGIGVTFGGHVLHVNRPEPAMANYETGFGMAYLARILEVVGVAHWENLKDKYCRMKIQGNLVVAIGNIIEEVWFYPSELGNEYQARAERQNKALLALSQVEFNEAEKLADEVTERVNQLSINAEEVQQAEVTVESESKPKPKHPSQKRSNDAPIIDPYKTIDPFNRPPV